MYKDQTFTAKVKSTSSSIISRLIIQFRVAVLWRIYCSLYYHKCNLYGIPTYEYVFKMHFETTLAFSVNFDPVHCI